MKYGKGDLANILGGVKLTDFKKSSFHCHAKAYFYGVARFWHDA